jgi:hypothetical protein
MNGMTGPGTAKAATYSNLTDWDAEQLWRTYSQLSEAEAAFGIHKRELAIRPIWHQREDRVRAHILVCFLGMLSGLRLVEDAGAVARPRRTGQQPAPHARGTGTHPERRPGAATGWPEDPSHKLRIRCVVRPDKAQALLLDRLGLRLPERLRLLPLISEMM